MKLIKCSIVASIVLGLFSTINATSLDSIIGKIDVSGYIRYRYYNEDNSIPGSSTDRHRFTVPVMFKVQVSDHITAGFAMLADKSDYATDHRYASSYYSYGQIQTYSDTTFNLSRMWFNYNNNGLNIKLGRQIVDTPLSEGGITGTYGDGVLVTYNAPYNTTLIAAAFVKSNQTTDGAIYDSAAGWINGSYSINNDNVYYIAGMTSYKNINAQLWAFKVNQIVDAAVFGQLDAKFGDLTLTAQDSWVKITKPSAIILDWIDVVKNEDDTGNFIGLKADYKIQNINLGAGYTSTSKNNGVTTLDADGKLIKAGKQLYYHTTNARDTDVYFLTANTNIKKWSAGAGFVKSNSYKGSRLDGAKEFYGEIAYKYNHKTKVSAYYSDLDMHGVGDNVKGGDNKEFRLEVKYSF